MITDEQVVKALDYLRDTSKEYAYWKSLAKTLETFVAITEAELIDNGDKDDNVTTRRMKAKASPEYKEKVEEWKEALHKALELEGLREAAQMRISYWQTYQRTKAQGLI